MLHEAKMQEALKKAKLYGAMMRNISLKSIVKAERQLMDDYHDNKDIVVGIKLMTDKIIEIAEKDKS